VSAPQQAIREGARVSVERTFTVEEVRAFAEMSGDRGVQHLDTDAQGRLMVHGLLLASLPTQVGGQLNFLARELTFEFLRPAWTGSPIRCEVVVERAEPGPRGIRLECTWEAKDVDGQAVMRGRARGLVPGAPSASRPA
jgi:3-hydroxybutyryl-CoA dehydratase